MKVSFRRRHLLVEIAKTQFFKTNTVPLTVPCHLEIRFFADLACDRKIKLEESFRLILESLQKQEYSTEALLRYQKKFNALNPFCPDL